MGARSALRAPPGAVPNPSLGEDPALPSLTPDFRARPQAAGVTLEQRGCREQRGEIWFEISLALHKKTPSPVHTRLQQCLVRATTPYSSLSPGNNLHAMYLAAAPSSRLGLTQHWGPDQLLPTSVDPIIRTCHPVCRTCPGAGEVARRANTDRLVTWDAAWVTRRFDRQHGPVSALPLSYHLALGKSPLLSALLSALSTALDYLEHVLPLGLHRAYHNKPPYHYG